MLVTLGWSNHLLANLEKRPKILDLVSQELPSWVPDLRLELRWGHDGASGFKPTMCSDGKSIACNVCHIGDVGIHIDTVNNTFELLAGVSRLFQIVTSSDSPGVGLMRSDDLICTSGNPPAKYSNPPSTEFSVFEWILVLRAVVDSPCKFEVVNTCNARCLEQRRGEPLDSFQELPTSRRMSIILV